MTKEEKLAKKREIRHKWELAHPEEHLAGLERRKKWRHARNQAMPWFKYYRSSIDNCRWGKPKAHTLTKEQVKEMWYRDKAEGMIRPSIDRIDPEKGYVFENCRFLELIENYVRQMYPNHNLVSYKFEPKIG
jgi:hypothetical protein